VKLKGVVINRNVTTNKYLISGSFQVKARKYLIGVVLDICDFV
jgi:hypothetical protein